ncbi:hypothetical protein [Maribacter sp. 2307ULW6-5]|uniref:hypothetical protein n=1 Tax=Maribacter sp. 2307ULW6-5 TaxID=3386275 RepID=UPI0039BCE06C
MKMTAKKWKIILLLVIIGFVVGIYLQDREHQKSTTHAWTANRYNLARFNKITEYNDQMDASNWRQMKDSIRRQLDTVMILRFRKEVDSLNARAKVDN